VHSQRLAFVFIVRFLLDLVIFFDLSFSVERASAKLPPPLLANLTAFRTLRTSEVFPGSDGAILLTFFVAGRPSSLEASERAMIRSSAVASLGANLEKKVKIRPDTTI
jgi:hypothetical protein